MKVVTADEMRRIDRMTIEDVGIPGHVLMERAGVAVARRIQEIFEKRKTIVLAGGGNNGGDGIVTARELFNHGWNVRVLMLIKEDRLSPDCLTQFRIAKKAGVPVEFRSEITASDLHGSIVVDALLGTGLNKSIEGSMAKVIEVLNNSGVPVVSIDVPSGISSDTGQIMGIAVRADYTVTFGLPKRGHLLYPGAEYAGRLFIEDIGFLEESLNSRELKVELLEINRIRSLIPKRRRYSHKGDYGHVFIVAGSRGKTGAAIMAARACLRTGAGLVTIGVPESLVTVFESRVTEEMTLPLPDTGNGSLSARAGKVILDFLSTKGDVLCIGPGIGVSDDIERMVSDMIGSINVPVVIDADAINSIHDLRVLRGCRSQVVMTPHPGEMARLISKTESPGKGLKEIIKAIEEDRINTALNFASDNGLFLVLKGVPTIIANPEGDVFINPTGNPGMATAGTGDVLTGMIGSLIGQGLNALNASILAVYIHGLAGDIAKERKGEQSLIASDIIEAIPEAIKRLEDFNG